MVLENPERYPRSKSAIPDFRTALRHYILPSFVPERPFLPRASSVVTQGSCFAANIAHALSDAGVKATWLEIQEVMNSPLANRTYLEYLVQNRPVMGVNNRMAVEMVLKPENLSVFRTAIKSASLFIFTAGLAYCQFSDDGEFQLVGVRGEPSTWRLTTVEENQNHIEAIIGLVRSLNPDVHIVLTVSPIPLTRSPTLGSAFSSDCLSKSVLRAAVGQLMERRLPNVHYWPSFEAIRWLSGHLGPFYGVEGEDERHPGMSYINELCSSFVDAFFQTEGTI